jgi:Tfp pilus assembly PilM family ATPase
VANAVAEGKITVVPEVLVAGGGGALDGLAATLMRTLGTNGQHAHEQAKTVDAPADPVS